MIENLCFPFVRINSDPDLDPDFDSNVEMAIIDNYINELSLKLAANSAKKSLNKNLANQTFHSKNTFCPIKMVESDQQCVKSKEKPKYVKRNQLLCRM